MGLCQKIITAGLIIGSLTAYSCGKNEPPTETITGIPISVQTAIKAGQEAISTMIELPNGKYQLCQSQFNESVYAHKLTNMATIIESEINDGDSEPIEIMGYKVRDRFIIKSVSANGYSINVKE